MSCGMFHSVRSIRSTSGGEKPLKRCLSDSEVSPATLASIAVSGLPGTGMAPGATVAG